MRGGILRCGLHAWVTGSCKSCACGFAFKVPGGKPLCSIPSRPLEGPGKALSPCLPSYDMTLLLVSEENRGW